MRENYFNKKVSERRPVLGIGLSLGSPRVAEMISCTTFDFVMVDLQHGHFDKGSATDCIRSIARAGGPVPFGRVSRNEQGAINDLLDAGAMGIIVPMIDSAAEVEAALQSCYYPPLGKRSKGSAASIFYGADYPKQINQNLSVIAMIETPEGVSRADEILSAAGLKGCLIGGSDLAFVMQCSRDSVEFLEAVDHVVASAINHGVAPGINVNTVQEAEYWWSRGIQFFLASHDLALVHDSIRRHDAGFAEFRKQGGL
jgi:4-hydroxy-2-oxoheptanedioate aldolase